MGPTQGYRHSSASCGVPCGLLVSGVTRVVAPRKHPPEQAQPGAAAPAVLGAAAPHRPQSFGDPVAEREEQVAARQRQDDAPHLNAEQAEDVRLIGSPTIRMTRLLTGRLGCSLTVTVPPAAGGANRSYLRAEWR
jgi:hypothetical protein